MKSFLGKVSCMRRFMPALAEVTEPFEKLLKGKTEWDWGQDQQQAFVSKRNFGLGEDDGSTTERNTIAAVYHIYRKVCRRIDHTRGRWGRKTCILHQPNNQGARNQVFTIRETLSGTGVCRTKNVSLFFGT